MNKTQKVVCTLEQHKDRPADWRIKVNGNITKQFTTPSRNEADTIFTSWVHETFPGSKSNLIFSFDKIPNPFPPDKSALIEAVCEQMQRAEVAREREIFIEAGEIIHALLETYNYPAKKILLTALDNKTCPSLFHALLLAITSHNGTSN